MNAKLQTQGSIAPEPLSNRSLGIPFFKESPVIANECPVSKVKPAQIGPIIEVGPIKSQIGDVVIGQ